MFRLIGVLALIVSCAALGAPAQQPSADFAALVSMQKQPEGTFFVSAGVDGHAGSFELLVDTGSSFTVINEHLLEELKKRGAAEHIDDIDGVMADGSHRDVPLYRLTAMRIGDACWIHDVEAAVFPGDTRPILGMSVLSRLAPFTVSDGPPTLTLNKCQKPSAAANL